MKRFDFMSDKKIIVFYLLFLFNLFFIDAFATDVAVALPEQPNAMQRTDTQLKNGWYPWDPYQYVEGGEGFKTLTGLDVQLVKAIAKKAGYNVFYEEVSWKQHLDDIKTGKRDFAAGATWTEERAEFAYYSTPYRREENSLYVRRGELSKYNFGDVQKSLDSIKEKNLRVSVVDGFIYADPRINEFIKNPENQKNITKTANDMESLENLLNGNVDAFFADRLVTSTIAWRMGSRDKIEEQYLGVGVDIHLVFSKKSTTPKIVEEFNKAITEIKKSGEYGHIIKGYLLPVLLLQTIDRPWFLIIDIIGTIAFALSGLIVAYHERTTLFGALIFAALPSVGGGILRDIIVDRKPIGILSNPIYAILILSVVIIGYLFTHFIYPYVVRKFMNHTDNSPQPKQKIGISTADRFLVIFDALGQAAFTVSGVVVAVVTKSDPLWIWGPAFGALTGAGGGILRDLLRSDNYIYALKGAFYAEVSLIWGFIMAIFLIWQEERADPNFIFYLVVISVIGCFFTRILTMRLNFHGAMFGEPLRRHLETKKTKE
ncbi:MAG: transporter substrate-binding domain-containing protein [Alphaproteobacteria bacterium]|nr:transporter substrate-binding domain-containing protein [Alphaproteobacteria bacterium]